MYDRVAGDTANRRRSTANLVGCCILRLCLVALGIATFLTPVTSNAHIVRVVVAGMPNGTFTIPTESWEIARNQAGGSGGWYNTTTTVTNGVYTFMGGANIDAAPPNGEVDLKIRARNGQSIASNGYYVTGEDMVTVTYSASSHPTLTLYLTASPCPPQTLNVNVGGSISASYAGTGSLQLWTSSSIGGALSQKKSSTISYNEFTVGYEEEWFGVSLPGQFDWALRWVCDGTTVVVASGTVTCLDEFPDDQWNLTAVLAGCGEVPPDPEATPTPKPTPKPTPTPSPPPSPSPSPTPTPKPASTPDPSNPAPGQVVGGGGLAEPDIYEAVRRALHDAANESGVPSLDAPQVQEFEHGLDDAGELADPVYAQGGVVIAGGEYVPVKEWYAVAKNLREVDLGQRSEVDFGTVNIAGRDFELMVDLQQFSGPITIVRAVMLMLVTILFLFACGHALRH